MSKIGRNDPCPCGSGKKYKKCCLDKDVALPHALSAKIQAFAKQVYGLSGRKYEYRDKQSLMNHPDPIIRNTAIHSRAFAYTPDDFNKPAVICYDVERYSLREDDVVLAHEIGHEKIRHEGFKKIKGTNQLSLFMGNYLRNLMTDRHVDEYINQQGFNPYELKAKDIQEYTLNLRRYKKFPYNKALEQDKFMIVYLAAEALLLRPILSQEVIDEFLDEYKKYYLDEFNLAEGLVNTIVSFGFETPDKFHETLWKCIDYLADYFPIKREQFYLL